MGRGRVWAAGAVASAALLVPGAASAALVYFHKPAVTRVAFVADATECEALASGVQAPRIYQPYSPNPYAAGAAGFLSGFMRSHERRGMIENVLRTCMADKGYRRIEATAAVRKRLDGTKGEVRLESLWMLAAALVPEGVLLPR